MPIPEQQRKSEDPGGGSPPPAGSRLPVWIWLAVVAVGAVWWDSVVGQTKSGHISYRHLSKAASESTGGVVQ
jgi:hypothetical protein